VFEIIYANFGFWFNLLLPIFIGGFLLITNQEYIKKEFLGQIAFSFLFVTASYYALFSFTTDIVNTEYLNGKVTLYSKYEEWTEEVTYQESYSCGTRKNPSICYRQRTRNDYHSPYWEITSSLGNKKKLQN